MDMESVAILKDELHQLLAYIQKNSERYFVKEYENASPDYVAIQQASWTIVNKMQFMVTIAPFHIETTRDWSC